MLIESFVLYTERHAGTKDTGHYHIHRLDGSPVLSWHYTPVHLWQQPADSLLNLGKPGIIPLTGLMSIQQPETTLPQIAAQVKAEPDEEKRGILFSSLLALMSDEEHLKMMEQLLEADESVLNTPYLRRHRNELEVARAKIKQEDILEVVAVKLDPPATIYREIEKQVAQISNPIYLNEIFSTALQTDNIADVQRVLTNALADEQS